jgi:hypothetical protein
VKDACYWSAVLLVAESVVGGIGECPFMKAFARGAGGMENKKRRGLMVTEELIGKIDHLRKELHEIKKRLNITQTRTNNAFVNTENKIMELLKNFSQFQFDLHEVMDKETEEGKEDTTR